LVTGHPEQKHARVQEIERSTVLYGTIREEPACARVYEKKKKKTYSQI
jgi:hypothetical protein